MNRVQKKASNSWCEKNMVEMILSSRLRVNINPHLAKNKKKKNEKKIQKELFKCEYHFSQSSVSSC